MKLISIPEYAIKKRVSIQTVYNQIKDGKIKTRKFFGKTLIII